MSINKCKVSYNDKIVNASNLQLKTIDQVFDQIKTSPDLELLINQLRAIDDPKERRDFKKNNLPYFVGGEFIDSQRSSAKLKSSELFIFDFDHVSNLPALKEQMLSDNRVYAFFTSPGGNGLKVIYRLNNPITDYKLYSILYKQVAQELQASVGVDADKTSDASRACFLSYDPNLYVNEESVPLEIDIKLPEVKQYNINVLAQKSAADDLTYVPTAIEFLRKQKLNYPEWLHCGLALASLGETGRAYFHSLSNTSHYNDTPDEINEKFNNLLQTKDGSVTLSSLFHLAIDKGYSYPEITEQEPDNDFALELEEQFHRDDTRDPNKLLGFPLTKFKQLAKYVDGIQPGFYLLGAESNIGKTAVLTNLCLDLLETNPDIQVLYFSLDDNRIYTTYRLLSIKTQFPINDVRKKQVNAISKIELDNSRDDILELVRNQRLILKDISHVNHFEHIEAEIKKVADPKKLVVFIDGLYNLDVTASKGIREENIERAKQVGLVDTYRIPIMTTGELRKKSKEDGKDKAPTIHDLMETGKFAYNANVVWMLYGKAEELKSSTPTLTLEYVKNKLSDFKGETSLIFKRATGTMYEVPAPPALPPPTDVLFEDNGELD